MNLTAGVSDTYTNGPDSLYILPEEVVRPLKKELSAHRHPQKSVLAKKLAQGSASEKDCELGEERRGRVEKIQALFLQILMFCGKAMCHEIAVAADSLLRLDVENPCYYAKRKNLELPHSFKLIVDRRANAVHLIPKKIPESQFSCGFKHGRTVYSVNIENETASTLWALTSHNSKMNNRSHFLSLQARAMENVIYKRVTSGYPKRLHDYDVRKNDTGKRVALYETYGLNDLHCVDNYLGDQFDSMAQRLFILRNAARALQPFHQKNIAVRDIKLANIVVREGDSLSCSDWPVAFCDFDFTCDQSVLRTEPAPCSGSPECMAPEIFIATIIDMSKHQPVKNQEQLQRAEECSQQVPTFDLVHGDLRPADIYSLGVTFYMFLIRKMVDWAESDVAGILDGVFQFAKRFDSSTVVKNMPYREKVIQALEYIVHKMMCVDYTKRPNIDEVVTFFDNLMADDE